MAKAVNSELIDSIQIAAPCTASWERMVGDDKVRFCDHCGLNVYNIAEMTTDEASRLILDPERTRPPCLRLYRRSDGTVITRDCPLGVRRLREACSRKWKRLVAGLVSLLGMAGPAAADEAPQPQRSTGGQRGFAVAPNVPPPSSKDKNKPHRFTTGVPRTPNAPHTSAIGGVPAFDYGPYMKEMQKGILAQWTVPDGLRQDSNIVVEFTVDRKGVISKVKLQKSCGNKAFDDAALDAVRRSSPAPPLPSAGPNQINIQFTFNRKLLEKASDQSQK